MVLTQKVGGIKFFVNQYDNIINKEERDGLFKYFEKLFNEKLDSSKYKEALYFDSTYHDTIDFIIEINISILYLGLYQTEINYSYIYPYLTDFVSDLANTFLEYSNKKYLLAVMELQLITQDEICAVLERSEAQLIKSRNDNKYSLFSNEDDLQKIVKENIDKNFFFVNCHRKTNFHEIDPKLIEARLSLTYGLNNASIALICITLEETLKTLLKYNYIHNNRDKSAKPSLKEVKSMSNIVQKKYGSDPLGECIKKAYQEKLITDEEKSHLNRINNYLRNAHIHSDKSKMFAKNKTSIQLVTFEEGRIKVVDEDKLSMNEFIYGQGYLQMSLSTHSARILFYEIEDIIYTLCDRYWKSHKSSNNTYAT